MVRNYKSIYVANLDPGQSDCTPVYVVNFDCYQHPDEYVRIINFDTPDPRPGSYEHARIINFDALGQRPSGYERVYVINPDILIYFGFSPEGLGRVFDPVLFSQDTERVDGDILVRQNKVPFGSSD